MPTELPAALSIRKILMRIAANADLVTKGTELSNAEVDNNFIIIYETLKDIYLKADVDPYVAGNTYAKDDIVVNANIVHLSLVDGNQGFTPGAGGSEANWGLCSLGDLIKVAYDETVKSGIVAAGTDKDDAKIITKKINRVDTVASNTGVINGSLEKVGRRRIVQNNGVNELFWYPFLGSKFIELDPPTPALGINEPIIIAPGNQESYVVYTEGELTLI